MLLFYCFSLTYWRIKIIVKNFRFTDKVNHLHRSNLEHLFPLIEWVCWLWKHWHVVYMTIDRRQNMQEIHPTAKMLNGYWESPRGLALNIFTNCAFARSIALSVPLFFTMLPSSLRTISLEIILLSFFNICDPHSWLHLFINASKCKKTFISIFF